MADIKRSVEIIFRGKNNLTGAVSGVEDSLSGISSEAKDATASTGKMGDQLENLSGRPAGSVNFLTNALKTLAASAALKEFITANAQIESFSLGVESVTGETGRASKEMAFLRETSERLGLNLQGTTNAYLGLLAATEGTSLAGESSRQIFESVAQAMAVLGKSSADTDGALNAITQIVSKSVVSMEELRQQLGERLPGAFGIAATSMGKTTEEFDALVSSGSLLATDFLPKFAAELQSTFDVERVTNYRAEVNRLKNALTEASLAAGDAGAFDLATSGVKLGTEAIKDGTREVGVYRQAWLQVKEAFTGDGSVSDRVEAIGDALTVATLVALNFGQGIGDASEKADDLGTALGDAADSADDIAEPVRDALEVIGEMAVAASQTQKLLKEIGVDPKKLVEPIEDAVLAFDELSRVDGVSGDDLFSGLLVTLDRLKDVDFLPVLARSLAQAFDDGNISAAELADSYDALRARGDELSGSSNEWSAAFAGYADSLQKSTGESRKAEVQAIKTATELEKIASNERIKNIEAIVTLNVAGIEADSKRAVAIIETIGVAIQSTGDLLSDLFGNRIDADSWSERRLIEQAIRVEEENRENVLRRQNKLIDAQIAKLRAQTSALKRGEGLITVKAEGLQPHLEAFMFEIFEALQVRVNEEGYELLLGTG